MTHPAGPSLAGRIVFLSHGGGPLPVLGDPGHAAMVAFTRALPDLVPRPDAILVVSAHWEEDVPTVLDAPRPPLLFDYTGFPPESYELQYPAPGAPELAARIAGLLDAAGIAHRTDGRRGLDHGVFIPLLLAYPAADIPVTQLSLVRGLDPARHLDLGRALRPLLDANVLVIGSGFSFHDLPAFFRGGGPDPLNDAFQDWLVDTCAGPHADAERRRRLEHWADAPGARHCHPREEHLLPLHVCVGLAPDGQAAEVVFDDAILGKRALGFRWSAEAASGS